ncbi:MAG: metalloregulator ArsR/SmtB family transcription factor [Vicinamibacterales bacterium]|nr:metalloregulator ArsR/SmtB family transcription factor [Vicinamibacterales bacterium]
MSKQKTLQDSCCLPEEGRPGVLLPSGPEADEQLAAFAKAIAHPVRVQILRMLARKDARQCCQIVDELPLAQSTVSEHLRILRAAGLVQSRGGPRVGYCIVPEALRRFKGLLDAV